MLATAVAVPPKPNPKSNSNGVAVNALLPIVRKAVVPLDIILASLEPLFATVVVAVATFEELALTVLLTTVVVFPRPLTFLPVLLAVSPNCFVLVVYTSIPLLSNSFLVFLFEVLTVPPVLFI